MLLLDDDSVGDRLGTVRAELVKCEPVRGRAQLTQQPVNRS